MCFRTILKNYSQHLSYRILFSQETVLFHLGSGSPLTRQKNQALKFFNFIFFCSEERKSEEWKKTKDSNTVYDATQQLNSVKCH